MTRPSDHYPRRCGCGHHAADPAINDHPISLRDDLDALKARLDAVDRVREALDRKHQVAGHAPERDVVASGDHGVAGHVGHGVVGPRRSDARLIAVRLGIQDPALLGKNVDALTHGSHDDSSTDAARAGIPDAAPTVEADTPTRAGIGVEDATTPAPSTSDDIVSVSISLSGDRELVELVAALMIGGVYRSRSAAQRRVDLINRWLGDGAAVLVEATCNWVPVQDANARRAHVRRQARIDKLRAQIEALTTLDEEAAS